MKVSIIIPAYNESRIIAGTIHSIVRYLSGKFNDYELLIVNDGSTDNTLETLQLIRDKNIRVISYDSNRGKGYAIKTGMLNAAGDIIIYTDADLAYGLDVIEKAVEIIEHEHADIVIGSRKISRKGYEGYPLIRIIASKCFGVVTKLSSGLRYDTQCGFKCFSKEACLEVISNCTADGFAFDFEVLLHADRLNLAIMQMPVKIIRHEDSQIKILRDSLTMIRDIILIRQSIGARRFRRQNATSADKIST